MDVQVPRPITRGLRQRGIDVLTAQEDGIAQWADPELLDRATFLDRILFSQDADLLAEASNRNRRSVDLAGLIYAPQQAMAIGRFIDDLELLAKAGGSADFANRVIYLPLRSSHPNLRRAPVRVQPFHLRERLHRLERLLHRRLFVLDKTRPPLELVHRQTRKRPPCPARRQRVAWDPPHNRRAPSANHSPGKSPPPSSPSAPRSGFGGS